MGFILKVSWIKLRDRGENFKYAQLKFIIYNTSTFRKENINNLIENLNINPLF